MIYGKPAGRKTRQNIPCRILRKKFSHRFQYIYDFGDNWIHQITVEKILPPEEGKSFPVLITGRRACPPEDIGGIHHYMHILEVLRIRKMRNMKR